MREPILPASVIGPVMADWIPAPRPLNTRNCLSYWFPKLCEAGVPVPKTQIVDAGPDWHMMLNAIDTPDNPECRAAAHAIKVLAQKIEAAAAGLGLTRPFFLRTGQFSGKHDWDKTCFIGPKSEIDGHVAMIIMMSEMFDMTGGLTWDKWCVREFLNTEPVVTLPQYGNMPLTKEVRAFVKDGRIVCAHPYWPTRTIADGLDPGERHRAVQYSGMLDCDETDYLGWSPVANLVAKAFAGDGAWSVDLLKTTDARDPWKVTDMAEAHRSYHTEGCAYAATFAAQ